MSDSKKTVDIDDVSIEVSDFNLLDFITIFADWSTQMEVELSYEVVFNKQMQALHDAQHGFTNKAFATRRCSINLIYCIQKLGSERNERRHQLHRHSIDRIDARVVSIAREQVDKHESDVRGRGSGNGHGADNLNNNGDGPSRSPRHDHLEYEVEEVL